MLNDKNLFKCPYCDHVINIGGRRAVGVMNKFSFFGLLCFVAVLLNVFFKWFGTSDMWMVLIVGLLFTIYGQIVRGANMLEERERNG